MDVKTLMAARLYVRDTANSLGAVKGSPCTITSITEADDGIHIVFSWTGADGTVATQTAIMPYVAVDKVAREAVETLRDDMDAAIDTTVRSINGRTPDNNGNVALPLSVTGVPNTGSPNQVFVTDSGGNPVWEDRTHGGERVTVEWDGTYDKSTDTPGAYGNESMNGLFRYWRISDRVPTKEELFSDDATCVVNSEKSDVRFEGRNWYGRWGTTLVPYPYSGSEDGSWPIVIVVTDADNNTGLKNMIPGTYCTAGARGVKVGFESLTYGWFKQLDPMYIPDGIGGVQPDWNQNDPAQPDYVRNRTHYTYGISSVYNESTEGLESFSLESPSMGSSYLYYKISDYYPDPALTEFPGEPGATKYHYNDGFNVATADDPCWYITEAGGYPKAIALSSTDAMLEDTFLQDYFPDQMMPSMGVWVIDPYLWGDDLLSFDYGGEQMVHRLSDVYIPESVARKTDITWDNLGNKPFGVAPEPITSITATSGAFSAWNGLPSGIANGTVYSIVSSLGWHAKFECEAGSFGGWFGSFELVTADYPDCPVTKIALDTGKVTYTGDVPDAETFSIYAEDKYGETTLDPKYLPPNITIPSGGSLTLESGATVNDPDGVLGGSGGAFVVTVTGNSTDGFTADKTYAELDAAYRAGQAIRCRHEVAENIFTEYTLMQAALGQGYGFAMLQYVTPTSTFNYQALKYSSDGTITIQLATITPAAT